VSAVPIRPLLEHNHAFSPEDVKVLVGAFEDTLHALKLTNRKDPMAITVAKIIIELAKDGERRRRIFLPFWVKSIQSN
jgi:hypothetical protein